MVDLQSLFIQFKREKEYLKYVTSATLRAYDKSWVAFKYHYGCICVLPTEDTVKAVMASWLQSGLAPGAANSYARSVNSFLSWLHESGTTTKRLRIQLAATPRRVLKTYSEQDARKIVNHKPTTRAGKRVLALLYLLIDTGARINEALSLTRDGIDWENFLVTLYGKGRKERKVPISPECRKALFRYVNTHNFALVFCTRDGLALQYHNIKRDFLAVLDAVGVEKSEGSFHAFRRFFGKTYLRNGGNSIHLKQLFGHTTMQMVARYVEEDAELLRDAHQKLSPLEGLKRR